MAAQNQELHEISTEDKAENSNGLLDANSAVTDEASLVDKGSADGRKTNKRLPSSSPNSQSDQKKLHRGDSSSSQNGEITDSMLVDDTFSSDGTSRAPKPVRLKVYSDRLEKSMAASSNFPTIESDLEGIEGETPTDSLYVQLRKLAGTIKERDHGHDGEFSYKNISLTPMIKNFFNPDHRFTVDPLETNVSTNVSKYVTENNLYLKSITKLLEGMNVSLKKNAESLSQHSIRLDRVEKFAIKNVDELKLKMQASDEERGELRVLIGKTYDYVDEKVNALKRAIPVTMDELGVDLERKQEETNDEMRIAVGKTIDKADKKIGSVSVRVDNLEKTMHEKFSVLEKNTRTELEAVRSKLSTSTGTPTGCDNTLVQQLHLELKNCQEKLLTYERELSKTNTKLDKALSDLDSNKGFSEQGSNLRKHEQKQQRALEELSDRLDGFEYNLKVNTQTSRYYDLQRRKNNVLIDQLSEVQNENLLVRLNHIVSATLNEYDRSLVVIKNAYRIGRYRNDQRNPRKIMVQLDGPIGREILIKNSRQVTKSGNDGRPYFINEDLTEAEKRKKNDLYKYKRYMEDRDHRVDREGDFFIIDGTKWHIDQLNELPIGDRLLDSRTRFLHGTVAFQSWVSPLSNLDLCRLRFNGKTYRSLEHAYQYAKAIHHGRTETANDIRYEPDPYVVMSYGNSITENRAWMDKKLDLMEQLVRAKEDQVAIFSDTLKRTFSYRIVENTWSAFWGSSCPFLSEIVWSGQFRGLNHLGRILEKVRDTS